MSDSGSIKSKTKPTEHDSGKVNVVESPRPSAEGELSLDDLFDETKNAQQNKSLLISYEMDRMGMGRYQWCIFFLCGLGYFIDLMWAQAYGLIATPIKNEIVGINDGNIGDISTAFSTGLAVGAFTWGLLVDVLGRRWSFYLTCLISSVFGMANAGPSSLGGIATLAAFVGFGVGGNIPIESTITIEFLPTNRRFLVSLLSIFQPLGVLVCCGIAYGFIPNYSCNNAEDLGASSSCPRSENMGWRYTLITLGCVTLGIFFLRFIVFNFYETAQFLLSRGRDQEALDVVASIAKFNKAPPPQFTIQDFEEIDRRLGSASESDTKKKVVSHREAFANTTKSLLGQFKVAKYLFSTRKLTRVTIIIWIVFIADFWAFSLAGYYLPQILADRGAAVDEPLSTTYAHYIAIYAPGILAVIIAAFLVEIPRLGRIGSMIFSSSIMAVSLFVYTTVSSQAAAVGLNLLEYFFQSMFNAILYAFVPEAYPSPVRGTASGFASTLGRISSIVAPLAGNHLYGNSGDDPESKARAARNLLYLAGGLNLVCPVALAFLPFETRGKRLY